jgi:hypothetical protein
MPQPDLTTSALRKTARRIIPLIALGYGTAYVGCGLSSAPAIALPLLSPVLASYRGMQGRLWAIPGAFLSGRPAAAGIAAINTIGILLRLGRALVDGLCA